MAGDNPPVEARAAGVEPKSEGEAAAIPETTATATATASALPKGTNLVMQIILRRDLLTVRCASIEFVYPGYKAPCAQRSPDSPRRGAPTHPQLTTRSRHAHAPFLQIHKWPVGPLLAQAAHAATAVTHIHRAHPDVQRYFAGDAGDGRGWEVMRKVTYEVGLVFVRFVRFARWRVGASGGGRRASLRIR